MARYEILCVDNDALVRHIISHEIEEAGHFVMSTGTAKGALAILAKNPTIDLVLVDYSVPDMAGDELVRRIQSSWPKVRLAVLTGYADHILCNENGGSQADGLCPVIEKNAQMEEILSGIEAAAKGETKVPSRNLPLTRVERLVSGRAARPALEGVQRQLQSIYEKTIPETLVKPFSKLLGWSGSSV